MKARRFSKWAMVVTAKQKERLGKICVDDFGRVFRYTRAGSGALGAGHMAVQARPVAAHTQQVQTNDVANAAGSLHVTVYVGASDVSTDQYKDGSLEVDYDDDPTLGITYPILSHSTRAGAGTIRVNIAEYLKRATTAGDRFSLIPNPLNGVTQSTTPGPPAGVAIVDVPSGHYYWTKLSIPHRGAKQLNHHSLKS